VDLWRLPESWEEDVLTATPRSFYQSQQDRCQSQLDLICREQSSRASILDFFREQAIVVRSGQS